MGAFVVSGATLTVRPFRVPSEWRSVPPQVRAERYRTGRRKRPILGRYFNYLQRYDIRVLSTARNGRELARSAPIRRNGRGVMATNRRVSQRRGDFAPCNNRPRKARQPTRTRFAPKGTRDRFGVVQPPTLRTLRRKRNEQHAHDNTRAKRYARTPTRGVLRVRRGILREIDERNGATMYNLNA